MTIGIERKMRLLVLSFVFFCGCFSQEGRNIILFPRQSATDHVILKPIVEKQWEQLTVCLRSYTEISRVHSLFSIAMPGTGKDNTFLIYQEPPNYCSIYINQEQIRFRVDPEVLDWKHTCVTWDSSTGLVQLWINGKRYPRRVTTTRSPIGPQMSIILGQEQDSFGGNFDAEQSFVGEMCDVNMWDYVLPPEKITQYFYFILDVIMNINGWINGTYTSEGNATVLINEFCSFYST
ncbi:jeltraxin-like [Dendropsophus ebraccatus]|uniref:jeltraxin-like n=1 Tax=Dendropsophus ebraccatus TaxID=150705 RepID=UPI003831A898